MIPVTLLVAAALVAWWASRVEDGAPGWRSELADRLVWAAAGAAVERMRRKR